MELGFLFDRTNGASNFIGVEVLKGIKAIYFNTHKFHNHYLYLCVLCKLDKIPELIEEWGMPKELILLNGDGHIWIALDYRNNKDEPAVVYINNESNEEIVLADSFDDFMERLYIEEDGVYSFNPDEEERKSSKLSDG